MPDTFNCPNCGAPMDYKGSDPIIRCPYCNSSVVVPENLRAKPEFSSKPSNYTFSGMGDMGGLINQARRFKEVKDLARAGNMDEAVRVYCEITGVSPEMARPSVEALSNGQPITLTGLNMGDLMGNPVRVNPYMPAPTPAISIKPVDEKTSKGIARGVGCAVGCFVVGLVAFILITVLVPMAGGLAGIMVGLNPDLALTALPYVSGTGAGYGTKELSFGGEGTGPGLFEDPRTITVDPVSGNIYVGEFESGRVQKFDPQGKFITQWVVDGKKPIISSLAADRKGNVYVVSLGKLLRYTSDTTFNEVKVDGFDRFDYAVVAPDGSFVGVNGEDVVHFTSTGKILGKIPAAVSTVSGDSELDADVAVDGSSNIYILGHFNEAVFKFSPDGKFVNRFGSRGDQPGQFTAPSSIAVDGKGRVYVSDMDGIRVFSNDGRYLNVITVEFAARSMAFDDQGKLYIATNHNTVEKYSIPEE